MTQALKRPGLVRVLRVVDWLLQRLVPAAGDRVAWMTDPDYIGNAFHLYRHAVCSRPGLHHIWLAVDPDVRDRVSRDLVRFGQERAEGTTVRVVNRHSVRGYWAYLRCRTVFHTHGSYPMVGSAHRRNCVSLWHGMPIKCIGALNVRSPNPFPTFGTTHLATSTMFRSVIAGAFAVPIDRVLVCSLPRCDALVEPHPLAPDRAEIFNALGVPPEECLVVWLPTYRSIASPGAPAMTADLRTFMDDLPDGTWEQMEEAAAENGCTVVVKLHPQDPLNDMALDRDLAHIRLLRSRHWLTTGIELYDMLAHADALISDVSSVLIDFLVTSRPIGIVGFDADTYTRDVVFPVTTLTDSERIHDLSDSEAVKRFFQQAAEGETFEGMDDLSPWLYEIKSGGREAVLQAAGL